jgi:hypothetical protein
MAALMGLTLFGSIFWGIFALVFLIVMLFVADAIENGFLATLFGVIVGLLFFFHGQTTWHSFVSMLTTINLLIYFSIGLVYALVRIFFHGRNEMLKFNSYRERGDHYDYNINRDIKENIFRWWFIWPISLIVWIVKDLVKDVFNIVYQRMNKIFDAVLELGIKSVKEVPKADKSKK